MASAFILSYQNNTWLRDNKLVLVLTGAVITTICVVDSVASGAYWIVNLFALALWKL